MKMSDIRGERTLEVIADLIEPVCSIAMDQESAALFRREKPPEGTDPRDYAAQRLRRSAPVLLRRHKGDVIAILAAIQGTSPEKYAKDLDLARLLSDLVDLLNDRAFLDLFLSARSGGSSVSAPAASKEGEG